MKIIFVNVEDHMFLNQRLNLALAAQKAGFEVVVASNKSALRTEIIGYGFKYIDTGSKRDSRNVFTQISSIYRLYQIFCNEQPSIIHNTSIKPVIYGSIAGRLSGVPKIVNLVNGLGYVFIEHKSVRRLIVKAVVKTMYRLALASRSISVIFQNPDDRDYFIDEKITSKNNSYLILGSGVDTDIFSPSAENPCKHDLTVLFFGRMLWDKGIEYLIDATKILKSEGIEFTLNLAGEPDKDNPSCIPLEQLKKWENDGLINYLGYCSDMVDIIRASDLVVLPTYYREGVPLSLIEAASVGKPIVTTDMPGCREIVVDGVNGFLVPVKDSVALADKIREILLNKDLRVSFGQKSRERAIDLFAKEIVTRRTIEIYLKS